MKKKPGVTVRGSNSGKPIMVLLDVLGQKWTLRILWELVGENQKFRELRRRCDDVSPTTLNKRVEELRDLQLIDHATDGYGLTNLGKELVNMLLPLHSWAENWAEIIGKSTA